MTLPNEQELKQLAEDIYKINNDNGFHDDGLNIHRDILLIITEIGAAVEAHRNKRFIDKRQFNYLYNNGESHKHTVIEKLLYAVEQTTIGNDCTESFKIHFESFIRGTFEEEIADTIIRILHLWRLVINQFEPNWNIIDLPKWPHIAKCEIFSKADYVRFFLELIYELSISCTYHEDISHKRDPLRYFFVNVRMWVRTLFMFCEHNNIDIMPIIRLKLEYNKLRGYKHGKEY